MNVCMQCIISSLPEVVLPRFTGSLNILKIFKASSILILASFKAKSNAEIYALQTACVSGSAETSETPAAWLD